jgi:mannose-6-phosphate isomerase
VQVHPDDTYAYEHENKSLGKNEMWYVIDAEPGTKLVSGLKRGVSKKAFEKAVAENKVEECLNYVDVKPGDCFNIPAGLVHAIGKGNLICEIQQSSNTTYRVYDYNRTDEKGNKRPLHVEKALDVIDFSGEKGGRKAGMKTGSGSFSRTYLAANEYFAAELIEADGSFTEDTEDERFHCFTVLEGNLSIDGIALSKGVSCLVPAALGEYTVTGKGKAIKSYVPDLEKNIRQPLLEAGFSKGEIDRFIG